jgi:uncharacterized protein (UPF0218 family)
VWVVPDKLRKTLSQPLGKVYPDKQYLRLLSSKNMSKVITVGDVVGSRALAIGYKPKIMVVDGKNQRKEFSYDWDIFSPKVVWNPAGTISLSALASIVDALSMDESTVLLVDGEEDMLSLAVIILAPIGYSVFYGQPGEGVVHVKVNHAKKVEALNIFNEMTIKIYGGFKHRSV